MQGFQEGLRQPQIWGYEPNILTNFSQKLNEKKMEPGTIATANFSQLMDCLGFYRNRTMWTITMNPIWPICCDKKYRNRNHGMWVALNFPKNIDVAFPLYQFQSRSQPSSVKFHSYFSWWKVCINNAILMWEHFVVEFRVVSNKSGELPQISSSGPALTAAGVLL